MFANLSFYNYDIDFLNVRILKMDFHSFLYPPSSWNEKQILYDNHVVSVFVSLSIAKLYSECINTLKKHTHMF